MNWSVDMINIDNPVILVTGSNTNLYTLEDISYDIFSKLKTDYAKLYDIEKNLETNKISWSVEDILKNLIDIKAHILSQCKHYKCIVKINLQNMPFITWIKIKDFIQNLPATLIFSIENPLKIRHVLPDIGRINIFVVNHPRLMFINKYINRFLSTRFEYLNYLKQNTNYDVCVLGDLFIKTYDFEDLKKWETRKKLRNELITRQLLKLNFSSVLVNFIKKMCN